MRGAGVIDGYGPTPRRTPRPSRAAGSGPATRGLDADGYLTLSGRLKELINRGGEKISPHEVEDALLAHPAVAEAVAFAVPHPTWGEEVAAAVVLSSEATEADVARVIQGEARRLQAAREADPHHHRHPADRHRQDSATDCRRGVRESAAVKIVVAGAGAIGGYIGAKLARAGADVPLPHRAQVRAAGEERDVRAGPRQLRADVAADRARAGDDKSHFGALANASATRSRWILPVAVRGMALMMWIFFGHLNSARRSLQ